MAVTLVVALLVGMLVAIALAPVLAPVALVALGIWAVVSKRRARTTPSAA
jgi:hypothetical protein